MAALSLDGAGGNDRGIKFALCCLEEDGMPCYHSQEHSHEDAERSNSHGVLEQGALCRYRG
jgi:hypothetical protein